VSGTRGDLHDFCRIGYRTDDGSTWGADQLHQVSLATPAGMVRWGYGMPVAGARTQGDAIHRESAAMRTDASFAEVAAFHGHVCPGLAIGYRMTRAALALLAAGRAEDEDLVAVVENDACGVDAVQFLSGCTFGKGNLVFRDYGKQAYTFFHRHTGRAVRVRAAEGEAAQSAPADRAERTEWLLSAPADDVVEVREVALAPPEHARIRRSVSCALCGERVMESRARISEGQITCIPCSEARPGQDQPAPAARSGPGPEQTPTP
jgi:formylmethanofuran dehydrogenase subunit E